MTEWWAMSTASGHVSAGDTWNEHGEGSDDFGPLSEVRTILLGISPMNCAGFIDMLNNRPENAPVV